MYFIPTAAAAAIASVDTRGATSITVLKPRRDNSEITQSRESIGPPVETVPSIGK